MRLILLLVITLFTNVSFAQQTVADIKSFENALQMYDNGQFQQAIVYFRSDQSPVSQLFLAKSYFALGQNSEAEIIAKRLSNLQDIEIQLEANYLQSLIFIGKKQFVEAINLLSRTLLLSENYNNSILRDISELQHKLIAYLSFNQRLTAIRSVDDENIRNKIVLDYYSDYPQAQATRLLEELMRIDSSLNLSGHLRRASSQKINVNNRYKREYPTGNIINMGVLLPSFARSANDKSVSRGLYNGLLISVDEFNRTNTDRKIKLHYLDSDEIKNNLRSGLQRAIDELNIDVIVGPLFSEQVEDLSTFVDRLAIPFIAPLANTFDISGGHDFILQINPSFESRGRQTARIAINSLKLHNFGVMTEKGTHGETDATAFAEEVTK
ncbi:MAG TPA: hypothetical protein DCE78_07010, partial [Bacteroidetes bacterium]|nr:hypothetical protein [Bacteroidota bacterium]